MGAMRPLLLLFTLVTNLVLADSFQLYSESSSLGREQSISNQTRLRYVLSQNEFPIKPVLQVGHDLIGYWGKAQPLDPNASYAYLSPGLQFRYGRFQLNVENRFRAFYPQNWGLYARNTGTYDFRTVAVLGDFQQTSLGLGFSAFVESYADAVLTSADQWNLIATSFVRLGTRYAVLNSLLVDAYLEPFISWDRLGHFYYNRADIKPSLRVQWLTQGVSVSVIGSWLWNTYISRAANERNPYQDIPSGFRLLLVVGGEFI